MGNTHLEPATKENLLEYGEKYGHKSPSRSVDALLAEHDLLLVTQGWLREVERIRALAEELSD